MLLSRTENDANKSGKFDRRQTSWEEEGKQSAWKFLEGLDRYEGRKRGVLPRNKSHAGTTAYQDRNNLAKISKSEMLRDIQRWLE